MREGKIPKARPLSRVSDSQRLAIHAIDRNGSRDVSRVTSGWYILLICATPIELPWSPTAFH